MLGSKIPYFVAAFSKVTVHFVLFFNYSAGVSGKIKRLNKAQNVNCNIFAFLVGVY